MAGPRHGPCSCTQCHDRPGEDRFSFGVYAGHLCAVCWANSGYRTAGREGFDPMYAGEHYDEEDAY